MGIVYSKVRWLEGWFYRVDFEGCILKYGLIEYTTITRKRHIVIDVYVNVTK